MSKLKIKKNDTVVVLTGEDKGKTGKVLKVIVDKQRAIVEGVNMVSKSAKPSAKNPQGGFVKQEASIHISNISLTKSGYSGRFALNRNEPSFVRRTESTTSTLVIPTCSK